MYNILISLAAGGAVYAGLFLSGLLRMGEAILPGVLIFIVVYFLTARRTFKAVENIFMEASRSLQSTPPKIDLAIGTMQKAYTYSRTQIGVRTQVDAQIGMVYFLQKDFNKAQPLLKRSLSFSYWMAAAMLAVVYYKKKDHAAMRETIDVMVKRGKKESLAWNLGAYLLIQVGDRDGAQTLLNDGMKKTKDDPKIKENLLAVQNGRKVKMRGYKEQWYQFHLERPPVQYQQMQMGRGGKAARRGRW